jgi:hypothetical protein
MSYGGFPSQSCHLCRTLNSHTLRFTCLFKKKSPKLLDWNSNTLLLLTKESRMPCFFWLASVFTKLFATPFIMNFGYLKQLPKSYTKQIYEGHRSRVFKLRTSSEILSTAYFYYINANFTSRYSFSGGKKKIKIRVYSHLSRITERFFICVRRQLEWKQQK